MEGKAKPLSLPSLPSSPSSSPAHSVAASRLTQKRGRRHSTTSSSSSSSDSDDDSKHDEENFTPNSPRKKRKTSFLDETSATRAADSVVEEELTVANLALANQDDDLDRGASLLSKPISHAIVYKTIDFRFNHPSKYSLHDAYARLDDCLKWKPEHLLIPQKANLRILCRRVLFLTHESLEFQPSNLVASKDDPKGLYSLAWRPENVRREELTPLFGQWSFKIGATLRGMNHRVNQQPHKFAFAIATLSALRDAFPMEVWDQFDPSDFPGLYYDRDSSDFQMDELIVFLYEMVYAVSYPCETQNVLERLVQEPSDAIHYRKRKTRDSPMRH